MAPVLRIAINEPHEAPLDAYVFLDLSGGIFYVDRKKYPDFVTYLLNSSETRHFTMDLASAQQHSLIFDLDFKSTSSPHPGTLPNSIVQLIHSTLTYLFFPYIQHFSYILAMRVGSAGIHVHLPEFTISHDDYILLCKHLQPKLLHRIPGKGTYHLDILTNATLSKSCKVGTEPYQAIRIVYAEEGAMHSLGIDANVHAQVGTLNKHFKRRKNNVDSVFRKLLVIHPSQFRRQLNEYMMPVPCIPPLYKLTYATLISTTPSDSSYEDVATFTLKRDGSQAFIAKGDKLLLDGMHALKAFQYIRFNAFTMKDFQTKNHALKMWFERQQGSGKAAECRYSPLFQDLNQTLKEDNATFERMSNPVKGLLEYRNGYYFVPVFYALCKHLGLGASSLVQVLQSFLDSKYQPLLRRLERVDENHVASIVQDITFRTIHFCGSNLYPRPNTVQEKLKRIVLDSKRAILTVGNQDQLMQLLRGMQERHFPIMVLCMCNALKKPSRYYWNFLAESWQEVVGNTEIHDHLSNMWYSIKSFLNEYKQTEVIAANSDVFDKFNLNAVVSNINSDTTMERKIIQMDRHKWFLRFPAGTLDLLTDHIGGTVPEFFLSDKKMGIDLPRQTLIELLSTQCPLIRLYEHLTNQKFFLRYLKYLVLNKTDDLFHTLREMIYEEMPDFHLDEYGTSMLHFYTHLCKYMSFEHDMFMFMLDVLASSFIATNYERRFFVLKGVTGNGKSKLFELLGKVFGGYYHNIQSDNLKPSNSSGNATPELASTLFSCRIVTLEELESKINENRVKQITGNSQVAFRNMYEQNVGGIPTAKVFSTTNKMPENAATQAFQERVVALPFHASFLERAPETTNEQVRQNTFGKDAYVVESSYVGCFLMLYYHLRKHMDLSDGLLHYRKMPDSVEEYTKDYLANTDIYMQFKMHMDVQIDSRGMTTMNQLRSAIRQFFKVNKNLSIHESDIIVKFEEEFGQYRKSDFGLHNKPQYRSFLEQVKPIQFENPSLLEKAEEETSSEEGASVSKDEEGIEVKTKEEEEPESPRKKLKKAPQASPVYYENVVIKNLKQTFES